MEALPETEPDVATTSPEVSPEVAVNNPVEDMLPILPVTLQVGLTETIFPTLFLPRAEKSCVLLIPTVALEGESVMLATSPSISPQPPEKMTNDKQMKTNIGNLKEELAIFYNDPARNDGIEHFTFQLPAFKGCIAAFGNEF